MFSSLNRQYYQRVCSSPEKRIDFYSNSKFFSFLVYMYFFSLLHSFSNYHKNYFANAWNIYSLQLQGMDISVNTGGSKRGQQEGAGGLGPQQDP